MATEPGSDTPAVPRYAESSPETGLIGNCMETILDIVQDIVRQQAREEKNKGACSRLKNEADMLFLWKDGLQLGDEKIDHIIQSSEDLRESTFTVLFSILNLLRLNIANFVSTVGAKKTVCGLIERIWSICPQLESFSTEHTRGESEGNLQGVMAGNEDSEEDQDEGPLSFEEFVVDFGQLSQDFREFATILYDFIEEEAAKNTEIPSLVSQNIASGSLKPADYFFRQLVEKFPSAKRPLLEFTSTKCWELYRSAKDALARRERLSQHAQHTSASKSAAGSMRDSTYESLLQSTAAPSLVEGLPHRAAQPLQMYTYALSVATTDSAFEGRRSKTPRPPVELGPEVSFVCNICNKPQVGIADARAWRKHVLSDIYPYICTFEKCQGPLGRLRFNNKAQWMAHEFEKHREITIFSCVVDGCGGVVPKRFDDDEAFIRHIKQDHEELFPAPASQYTNYKARLLGTFSRITAVVPQEYTGCPFCRQQIQNRRSKVASHVGRHLEEIALGIFSFAMDDGSEEAEEGEEESDQVDENSDNEQIDEKEECEDDRHEDLKRESFAPEHANPQKTVIQYFTCSLLRIGTWRRTGRNATDLVLFYSPEKAIITYNINDNSISYKIEFPFAYIKSIELMTLDLTLEKGRIQGLLVITLLRPPHFFMDTSGSGGFIQCGDFTEGEQATRAMEHMLCGNLTVLQSQVDKLVNLEVFQNRHGTQHDAPRAKQFQDSVEEGEEKGSETAKAWEAEKKAAVFTGLDLYDPDNEDEVVHVETREAEKKTTLFTGLDLYDPELEKWLT